MLLIAESQMMLLLNQLGDAAVVRAPLLGNTPLFLLNLSGRQAGVEQIVDSSEYARALDNVRKQMEIAATLHTPQNTQLAEDLKRELPDYNRLREAFRQAGVVEPSNLDEIRKCLSQAQESNPARGGDIYYFAFDNNALRNRLYSLYLEPRRRHDPHYNLLLSGFVRKELELREGKILYEFLDAFNAAYEGLGIPDIFQNQNRLKDRLRLLALAEWNRVQKSGDAEVEDAEDPEDYGDADGRIIEAYARFANKSGRKVVVFSSDNEFVMRCSGRTNLIGQLVSYPATLDDSYSVSWERVRRLLYQLSVLYGRIDLESGSGLQVRIYGVWREKGANEWDAEQVKLTFTPQQTPQERAIERNLRILRELPEDYSLDV